MERLFHSIREGARMWRRRHGPVPRPFWKALLSVPIRKQSFGLAPNWIVVALRSEQIMCSRQIGYAGDNVCVRDSSGRPWWTPGLIYLGETAQTAKRFARKGRGGQVRASGPMVLILSPLSLSQADADLSGVRQRPSRPRRMPFGSPGSGSRCCAAMSSSSLRQPLRKMCPATGAEYIRPIKPS